MGLIGGHVGIQYIHIPDKEECDWIRSRVETPKPWNYTTDEKRKSTRVQASFIALHQAGDIGDSLTYTRPRPAQEVPPARRTSSVSLFALKHAHKRVQPAPHH